VILSELTHSLRINQYIWIFEFLTLPLLYWIKSRCIWKYFITLYREVTIQKQKVNKQQRAWSQSGRQHMVNLVIVPRFELILLKPAKGFLAFISLHLIGKKEGVCLSCFEHMFSCYSYLTFTGVVWVLFKLIKTGNSCAQLFIILGYKVWNVELYLINASQIIFCCVCMGWDVWAKRKEKNVCVCFTCFSIL